MLPEVHCPKLSLFFHNLNPFLFVVVASVEMWAKRFCIEALEEALELHGTPEMFNTDQGSQFTSFDFTNILKESGIKISMDGKGRWMDNVFIERLWRSLKYECVYLNAFDNGLQARHNIGKWITYYNETRPHSTFDGQTPNEVYYKAQIYEGHAPHKWKEAA